MRRLEHWGELNRRVGLRDELNGRVEASRRILLTGSSFWLKEERGLETMGAPADLDCRLGGFCLPGGQSNHVWLCWRAALHSMGANATMTDTAPFFLIRMV